MKNLFLVINKEKIYAYVVSILTIVVLFFMSSIMNSDFQETEPTSSNMVENQSINNIENEKNTLSTNATSRSIENTEAIINTNNIEIEDNALNTNASSISTEDNVNNTTAKN